MKFRRKIFWEIVLSCGALALTGVLFVWNLRPGPCEKMSENAFHIHCFAVGKADAFFLSRSGTAILIDTGLAETSGALVAYLKEKNVRSLDLLLITHFDKDHMGGALAVLENFPVKKIIHPAYVKKAERNDILLQKIRDLQIKVEIPESTLHCSYDGLSLTVYPPLTKEFPVSPSNNSSLICTLKFGINRLMFAGDAEAERMHEFFTRQYSGGASVFLKVPKHGVKAKPVKEICRHFIPRAAVITSSDVQPEEERIAKFLRDRGTQLFLTRQGAIDICFDDRNMVIEQGNRRSDLRFRTAGQTP